MRAHLGIGGFVLGVATIVGEDLCDLIPHFVERRLARCVVLDHPNEVKPEVRLVRTRPIAGRKLEHGRSHRSAEQDLDTRARSIDEARLQRCAVADVCGIGPLAQRAQRRVDIGAQRLATLAGVEEHLIERHALRNFETLGLAVVERPELGVRSWLGVREVLAEIADLLHETAAHFVVIAIESERKRFAIIDFLANGRLDQHLELGACGLTALQHGGGLPELLDLLGRDHDRFLAAAGIAAPEKEGKQGRSDQQKVNEWILEEHGGPILYELGYATNPRCTAPKAATERRRPEKKKSASGEVPRRKGGILELGRVRPAGLPPAGPVRNSQAKLSATKCCESPRRTSTSA